MVRLNADIVLNGAPSYHDGTSDYVHWLPGPDWQYGAAYPCRSVVVQVHRVTRALLRALLRTHAGHVPRTPVVPRRAVHPQPAARLHRRTAQRLALPRAHGHAPHRAKLTCRAALVCAGLPPFILFCLLCPWPIAAAGQGNTFAPFDGGAALFMVAAEGVVLEANEMGSRTPAAVNASSNISLVDVGADRALYVAQNVHMRANTGFTAVGDGGVLANGGLVRLRPCAGEYHGSTGVHTWSNADPRALYRPRNLLGAAAAPGQWSAQGCTLAASGSKSFNGGPVHAVSGMAPGGVCTLTMLAVDLEQQPELRGQGVYLAVQANVALAGTTVALLMDPGTGTFTANSDSHAKPGWRLQTFQLPMLASGTARFALRVVASSAGPAADAVELGAAVLGRVGDEWSRL